MTTTTKLKYLKIALFVIGLILIVALMPLMHFWPSGWRWIPNQYEYEQMIASIYATLGVFLIIASRNPTKHLSLIWFTVWSSFVHAGVMAVQAIVDKRDVYHLIGDVPALFIIAIVLCYLTPREKELG